MKHALPPAQRSAEGRQPLPGACLDHQGLPAGWRRKLPVAASGHLLPRGRSAARSRGPDGPVQAAPRSPGRGSRQGGGGGLGSAVDGVGLGDDQRRRLARGLAACSHGSLARLQVFAQTFTSTFTAKARFAVPTKSERSIKLIRGIDPHHTGLDARCDFKRQADGFTPHTSGQAKAGVVGQFHGLIRRAKSLHDQDLAKDFLLPDFTGGFDIGDERGRKPSAFAGGHSLPYLGL